jgi:hypothetical protein
VERGRKSRVKSERSGKDGGKKGRVREVEGGRIVK